MSHINYFEPYESKSAHHEDQLTRAFMVVLRYVPSALLMFYDSVLTTINRKASERNMTVELPSISEIDLSNLDFETQTSNIDVAFKTNKIVSVLITDETFNLEKPVSKSDRNARYDGIIYFSSDVAIIVENKPFNYNVWEEQLSPSAKGLPEGVKIIEIAAIIEWKKIINDLNSLVKNNLIGKAEKEIVNDFLDFIDKRFPLLNPYDNFTDCKDNIDLLNRRVKNLLEKSVAKQADAIDYHNGWQCYYLKTPFPEIKMIGFKIYEEESDWRLAIEIWFGDTLSQSRELYKIKIDEGKISLLEEKGWQYSPNFHISFIQAHLVWLDTSEESKNGYIQYWINNVSDIKQYSKLELTTLLDKLMKNQIIEIKGEDRSEIEKEITNTNRHNFNISPGFGLSFSFHSKKAKELDSEDKLVEEIKSKIVEGIGILGKKVDFLK